MRLVAITVFALSALLTACTGAQGGNGSRDNLSTSETLFFSSRWTLSLPVSTTPGDTLYANVTWGIEIVAILADGRPVPGKTSYRDLDDPNIGPVTVQSGTFIYNVNLSHMLFGKLSLPLDYDLFEYEIPEDAKVLEIKYRLVPYDRDPDPRVYTAKALRTG